MMLRVAFAALILGAAVTLHGATAAAVPESRVTVARDGELILVDAILYAPVKRSEAWAVLTDFDAMSRFIPNLEESRVTLRAGNRLRVEQRGVARWGPLARAFTTVREVDLIPIELVRSRSVGGSLRRVRSETRLLDADQGTEVRHHLEFALEGWIPELLAEAFLRHEINEQFDAIVGEMMRRRAQPR